MLRKSLLVALVIAAGAPARAALFDDSEARKRILQVEAEMRQRDAAIDERIAKLEASVKNLGLLELINQIEELKAELSRLRGQMEVLNNQVSTVDKKQRDFYLDLDSRLRRFEQPGGAALGASGSSASPGAGGATSGAAAGTISGTPQAASPPSAVDPKEAARRAAAEKKTYDGAYALFQKRIYPAAISSFQTFINDYPASASAASAQYWIGLAYYNLRDLKSAFTAQQNLIKNYPDSPKVPDAMLAIAGIQAEQGGTAASRITLEDIVARYPGSEAAGKARQRLAGAPRG